MLLLGQAKVFSCALSLSRNKREAELPRNMGWPREERGAGEEAPPRGCPSLRARTFRTDLLEELPNSFPNIAPGRPPASILPRVPFTAPSRRGGTTEPPPYPQAVPGSRQKNPGGKSHGKHAWKLLGRAPPCSPAFRAGFSGEGMGCFGPFSPVVLSGPF